MHAVEKGNFYLITGGARSGKSSFAEELAASLSDNVMYIATATAWDEEMQLRIKQHQNQRPHHWLTVEEQLWVSDVIKNVEASSEVILIDCLTLLVTNMLLNIDFASNKGLDKNVQPHLLEQTILQELATLAKICANSPAHVILVTNEVGLGIVPDNQLGRLYRDVAGKANQLMAKYANEVYMVIAGIPVELKEMGFAVRRKLFAKN